MNKQPEDDDWAHMVIEAIKLVPKGGDEGEFPCPKCKKGIIRWLRVRSNRHLRMGCTTPGCIMMMQ